jgi:4-hydroxybenzoate-CoA ligase/benzoate-CoA ligase
MKAADLPLHYNAVHVLEHNLETRADKPALLSDERELTFAEVSAEVNQVGHALKGLGVRPGEMVALLTLDSAEWVTSFFGTLKVGAVHVGLNTLLTPKEFAYVLDDAKSRVLIVHEMLLDSIESARDESPWLEHVVVIGKPRRETDISYADWIAGKPTELEGTRTHREDFATLNYSSGTTGEPKGILHAHSDLPLTAKLWGENVLGLTENDRTFAGAKLFFTFGTGGNLIFPWSVGASCVLMAGPPRVAKNVLDTIVKFKPTILYNAPTGYAATMATPGFGEQWDLPSLRLCVSAGASRPAPIFTEWKERTGLDIIDGIGSTENYHIFLSNRPGDIRPGSSGKPFDGYELRLVDDDGADVPQGEVGNLWVKSETAALSYLHRRDRSRDTFRGEWLVTGDKYRVDEDGFYWHCGRSDDMLKVGGIWTSPIEVESALLGHGAVLECAVIGKTDDSDLVKPKAFVVLKEGESATEEELIGHCRETMAAYKRPRWVEFVDSLPKTATGKIQRFKLR